MNNKFNVKWAILSCLLICSVGSSAYATGTETLSTEKESTLTHNWLDRTDIKAKFQTNHEPQYALETLQPLGHYDEKTSKDLVFVQGSVSSNFGDVFTYDEYVNRPVEGVVIYEERQVNRYDRIGTTGSIGLGYRHLSRNENAYVGANAFYDYSFKDNYRRAGVGAEYVVGENKFYANFYKHLGNGDFFYSESIIDEPYPAPYNTPDNTPDTGVSLVHTSRSMTASGYDIGYSRTFKNARYLRPYINRYHWNIHRDVRGLYGMLLHTFNTYKDGYKIGTEINLTPHIAVDTGYNKPSGHSGEFYIQVMYTLGKTDFALFSGKHGNSDDTTTARSQMFDKVRRHDMTATKYKGEFHIHYPHDHL